MFALLGIIGALLAGMVLFEPFAEETDQQDDTPTDDNSTAVQTGSTLLESDPAAEQEDLSQTDQADQGSAESGNSGDGPDPTDQVYGKNIGDQMGANRLQALLFDDLAFTGTPQDDALEGTFSEDLMFGGDGADALYGHASNDEIHGDGGDDVLAGGEGLDVLHGGDGNDTLDGGQDSDLLTGGEGDDLLQGGEGDDKLFGQFGSDTLQGGSGDDILDGTQARTVEDTGTDSDQGDLLDGGEGQDTLILGSGDSATGGTGADIFISGDYIDPNTVPEITDFEPADDKIELYFSAADSELNTVETVAIDGGIQVHLNGQPVVNVLGVSDLDADSIILKPMQNLD